jgi:hypothetical protein
MQQDRKKDEECRAKEKEERIARERREEERRLNDKAERRRMTIHVLSHISRTQCVFCFG